MGYTEQLCLKKKKIAWNKGLKMGVSPLRGKKKSLQTVITMRQSAKRGSEHYLWSGGKRLAIARHRNKRRKKGFVLITNSNPYNEPIHYHHIHPDLPYVVPCPERIHGMFFGADATHFDNVNLMIGIKVPLKLLVEKPISKKNESEIEYEHYLETLRKQEYNARYLKESMVNLSFTETMVENIMLYERIYLNKNTGHITVTSNFVVRSRNQGTARAILTTSASKARAVLTAPETKEEIKEIEAEFYPKQQQDMAK